jgi:hypothetical protein
MNTIQRELIMQRWNIIQSELLPELHTVIGALTPKLEKLIHILEWVRIEELLPGTGQGKGRPAHERSWLANAFVAKTVLGISTTVGLIERLSNDRALLRICGFPAYHKPPSESTFSRVFAEFSEDKLAERAHEALIKAMLGDQLIGHISRDGTAIEARERPAKPKQATTEPVAQTPKKRGRPRKDEVRAAAKESPLERQKGQVLATMLAEIPTLCDRGCKSNAQGYVVSWNGYKLHIDTADCGVPIAAVLSSASMHDSRAAIPLSLISGQRVTYLYDVMDAAYCSQTLHEYSRSLGHVPLIDHNPRGGVKEEFDPADAVRYRERTVAERSNARLKDEFGGRNIFVRGSSKVMSHLMFGILVLSADQLMRLMQ